MGAGGDAGDDLGVPAFEGSGEFAQFGGRHERLAVRDGVVKPVGGLLEVGGSQHRPDLFFGVPAVGDLVVGVASVEGSPEALPACGVEARSAPATNSLRMP